LEQLGPTWPSWKKLEKTNQEIKMSLTGGLHFNEKAVAAGIFADDIKDAFPHVGPFRKAFIVEVRNVGDGIFRH
jgi:hypothetical protein